MSETGKSTLMVPERTVTVRLGSRSYPIWIGYRTQNLLGVRLKFVLPQATKALIVSDAVTHSLYDRVVRASLEAVGLPCRSVVVPSGEQAKALRYVARLYRALYQLGADRFTVVVALGGGVVGDLAGFAAATYARGVPFVPVPTTLLAQVDSSVGGKVAVNYHAQHQLVKNLIGAFHQPSAVLIDLQTLESLPMREYLSGAAEIVKYGMILDAAIIDWLEKEAAAFKNKSPTLLGPIVARCVELKAQVVEADEREETGLRSLLNFGHTFGHAIEAVTTTYRHGEAVALGMVAACRTAELLGMAPAEVRFRLTALLRRLDLPVQFPSLDAQAVLMAMRRDKKSKGGQLRLVLPTRIGQVQVVDGVDEEVVVAAIRSCQAQES